MTQPTILIVDDEPANLAVLNQLLSPEYRIMACKSGEKALQNAAKQPGPDLILLDVMMPLMDGYEVMTRLKKDVSTREIPVIFVTALDGLMDEERGLGLGAVDYITKPIKPAIVKARIHTHLELKRHRDHLKEQNQWLESEVSRRMEENLLIQDVSLCALAQLAETRDNETGNHILRTQAYVAVLGKALQSRPGYAEELADPQLDRIVKACPLHDIGKVGIPDRILLKPGKLTSEELDICKTHARIGADAIDNAIARVLSAGIQKEVPAAKPQSLAFLEMARVIALTHHEKWDGSGYPNGLAGEAIPLPGRLMALADVFDALITARVYKKAWTMSETVRHIREQKGRHFDPAIVDAFDSVLAEFDDIRLRFKDHDPAFKKDLS
jgi:putative two-component system response regulator